MNSFTQIASAGRVRFVICLALAATVAALGPLAQPAQAAGGAEPAAKAGAAPARASTAAAAAVARSAQRKIERLTRQIEALSRTMTTTQKELAELKRAVAVQKKQPDTAAAQPSVAPSTIGQHVGLLERDLGQMRKDLAENLGIHVHGLAEASYEYNFNRPGVLSSTRINQFRPFDTDANGFELSQFNLHIDRTVEGGVGFVTDLNFGKVGEILRGATRYSASGTPPAVGEVDPTQAYVTYTVPVGNGIDLMAGKFVTLIGAEVIKTYDALNYNESGGLIFTLGIPFTHTGLRATYAFNEMVALTLGINNGWDNVSDNNDGKSLEGQLALNPTPNLSMVINGMFGPEQTDRGNSNRGIIDPIITWQTPIPGLTLMGEYMYAHEDGPVAVAPLATGPNNGVNPLFSLAGGTIGHGVDWQAAAGYVIYDLNEKLQLVARGEYFRDSDGARTGIRQSLGEVTFTVNYKLADALLARFEYRHDESSTSPFLTNRAVPAALAGPGVAPTFTISGQDTVLGALVFTF